jgi:hypothetical protein
MMMNARRAAAFGVLAFSMLLPNVIRAEDGKMPDYAAIVAAPDRSDADRQADQRREPPRRSPLSASRKA